MKRNIQRPLSRKELLGIACAVRADYGEGLTLRRFCQETGLSRDVIEHVFGDWSYLKRSLDPSRSPRRPRPRFTNREIVQRLAQLTREHGGSMPQHEFCRRIGLTRENLLRRFGSWRELREAAGLPPRSAIKLIYSNQEMLDDLLAVYLRLGRCPAYHEHRRWGGRIGAATIMARFSNWDYVRIHFEEYHRRLDPNWTPETHKPTVPLCEQIIERPTPRHSRPFVRLRRLPNVPPQQPIDEALEHFIAEDEPPGM